MRSIFALLFVLIAMRDVDAQDGGLLSRRARLAMPTIVAPEEQQSIERAFQSAGWPIVTGHGPEDRATLMIFLMRTQPRDTTVGAFYWTVRVVDIESANVVYHLLCTSKVSGDLPSELPARVRRELADNTTQQTPPSSVQRSADSAAPRCE